MQFDVAKEDLLKGLHIVQNAIAQKTTLPILSNMLIEAGKNDVTLTAMDMDIGISSKIAIKPAEEGSITLPAKKLIDIVKELPEDNTVSVTLKKNNMVNIECGSVHCKIIGLPKDEFPKMPEFKVKEAIQIPQGLLKEMLTLTSFAVSRDETRYVLNGVLFIIKKDRLQLVATDGRRLAVTAKDLAEKNQTEKKAIVPTRTVQELIKILGAEGDVKIIITDNQTYFDIGHTNIISRLIEGEFPKFEDVIPKEKKEKARISRNVLLAAAKRASLFTNPDSMAIKLDLSKNKMCISKNTPYLGEVKEEIDIAYAGKAISIGFNPNYLIDLLNNIKDSEIELELDETDKPGVVRKGDEFTYVVLPMQYA